MGIYINQRCPKCQFSFTKGYQRTGVKSNLGLPLLKCPSCKYICRTNDKIYSMMNENEKNNLRVSILKQTLINALAASMLVLLAGMALGYVDNDNFEIFPHLIVAGILGTILSVIASYIHYKNMISKLEEIYKSKDKEYYADID